MFFCKDIFGNVPKALSVKEIQAIPDTFNLLETGILPYLHLVLFLSPYAFRLTLYEFLPCLVPARLGRVRFVERLVEASSWPLGVSAL